MDINDKQNNIENNLSENMKSNINGRAIAGFVCGIVALAIVVLGRLSHPLISCIALPIAIVGLVLSLKGKKKAKNSNEKSGLAIAGLVTSIISLVLSASISLIMYPLAFIFILSAK